MATVVIPEGSPLALEAAPKAQKLVKTTANKKPKAKKKASKPKAAPKAASKPKKKAAKKAAKKPKSAKASGPKPRGRGIRKDGKPRRRPGTNPASSPANERYGKKVAAARHKKELSQKQLADKVGCSQPGLANIERGVVGASEDMKKRIGKAVGIAA